MQSVLRAMPSAAFWSRSATTEDRIATNGERRSICLDFGSVTVRWRCCDGVTACHGFQNLSCFFKEKRLQREIATLSVIRLGLEPKTPTLKVLCSTSWASGSTLLLLSGCKDRNSFSYRQAFSIFFSGNVQKTFEWGSVCLPISSRLASVCFSDVMGNIQKTSDAPQSEHIACKSFSKRVGKRRLERPTPTSRT